MNMEDEVRDGYRVSAKMKRVWEIQLRMVRKVLEVCEKHGIVIWADGGTLLGAVRHGGYIPWDDDVDLFMKRGEYEKLLSVAGEEFGSPYFFQCAYTERWYLRGHAQVRYDGTTAMVAGDEERPYHCGIFIDIFVYDELPRDRHEFVRRLIRAEGLRKLMRARVTGRVSVGDWRGTLLYLYSVVYCWVRGFRRVFREFEELYAARGVEGSGVYSCPAFDVSQVFKIGRRAEWLSGTVWLKFEDMELPAPVGYEEVLRNQYGDYMTPVRGGSMHGGVRFEVDRDYREVRREWKK